MGVRQDFEHLASIKIEESMTAAFGEMAKSVFNEWIIRQGQSSYEIFEAEFLLQTKDDRHPDPNIDASSTQYTIGNWYLPESGVDITFGKDDYAAAIYIRGMKNVDTGELTYGAERCMRLLFQNPGSIDGSQPIAQFLKRRDVQKNTVIGVPRLRLPFEERTKNLENKLRFLFKPYRFILDDAILLDEEYLVKLYMRFVLKRPPQFIKSKAIYEKYINHYKLGRDDYSLKDIWTISSFAMRRAALLGYVQKNHRAWVF